jgi:hypothetical protein
MPLSAIILRRSYIRFEFVDFGTGYYVRLWALYALFRCGEILRTSFTSFSSVFEQVDDSLLLRKSVLCSNLNGHD